MLSKYREDFLNPDSKFTPIPFWFWNDILDKAEIDRQILEFKEKGVDGFIIHPRIGLPKEMGYLSEEFMDYVIFAIQRAKELNMQVILYDEAMYPSGSAHGQVVKKNPKHASKGLKMVSELILGEDDTLVATIDINKKTGVRTIAEGEPTSEVERYYFVLTMSQGTIRGIHFGEDDNEPDAPKSADLLNPEAVKSFIECTHERYHAYLHEYFGNTVTAIFTDEPKILGRCHVNGLIEWTDNFLEYYLSKGGKVTDLPLLFREDCIEKDLYKRVVNSLLSSTYYGQIATWCKNHNIMLTGHPENSDDIGFLKHFDIPSQDIVWRFVSPEDKKGITGVHSTMGKCSSDSARHHAKERNGNECFGCCGAVDDPFLFTREDMKWYLDWLFVRGVNMIFPHAFFYSMRDDRKNERPPDVGMNSSFWNEYKEISDYIKRMSGLLTGSVNQTEIAVLCTEDNLSWEIAKPLFENQIEFNYLEEDLLPDCIIDNGTISIAKQSYKVILIDSKYGKEAQEFLDKFKANNGIVIEFCQDTIVEDLKSNIVPDVYITPKNLDLRKTHIKKNNVGFIILTNEGEERISTVLHTNCGNIVEIWDPETGLTAKPETITNQYELELDIRKCIILVIDYDKNNS